MPFPARPPRWRRSALNRFLVNPHWRVVVIIACDSFVRVMYVLAPNTIVTRAGRAGSDHDTVVTDDEAAEYLASAALVAVTKQVPAEVALNTAPLIEQPLAVPPVTEYLTTPVPDPPLVVRVRGAPTMPFVLVRVSGDCRT